MIKLKSKTVLALLIVIGSCSILQFFIFGIVNIIRGYSMATYLPFSILLVGFIIFGVVLAYIYRKKPTVSSFFSITSSIVMIYVCMIGISHGRYLQDAKGYYDACQYQQALRACEKEAHTWYHRLRYNYRERTAMNLMAEAYCQLEDFDSARDTYKLMIDRYTGEFYGDRAQERLGELEKGLKAVAYYPDSIAESPLPDYIDEKTATRLDPKHIEAMVLSNIALNYMYDLNCHTKALEVYTRIIDMDACEKMKESAKDQILKLKVAPDDRDAVLLRKEL